MKKFFALLTLAGMLYSTSCSESYDDSVLLGRVDDLENRVARLEELCKQMNTNIASLQALVTAAQAHDCITSVVPVESGGDVIGYTITFSQNGPITIYHGKAGIDGTDGKDGMDGAAGKDGVAPVVGVKQDADGIYYWTLDGKWLTDASGTKIRTSGADGQNGVDGKPGQSGSDGKDGVDGTDGKDGQNGVTPQLKIENNGWYVSYNNGTNWTYLGQVPSGGTVATGDSMFRSVDTSHGDYVLFTLSDGTEIRVPKFGALTITFAEGNSLRFDIDETKTVNYTITGGGANNVMKAEMQNLDDAYTLYTTLTSATKGTIKITTKVPTANNVIVSVSNGMQTIMTAIDVSIKPSLEENVITVETPGTLRKLLADYDKTTITELTIIGNLNNSDISTLKGLPNLAILDMENVNLDELSYGAFSNKTLLVSVKLPRTLKSIGEEAFMGCRSLTNITIPDSVTIIEASAFINCIGLTSITIGNSVTTIKNAAFNMCPNLTNIYCKAQIPPTISSTAFSSWGKCTIYIPIGCKEAYAAANNWKQAKEIIEVEFE